MSCFIFVHVLLVLIICFDLQVVAYIQFVVTISTEWLCHSVEQLSLPFCSVYFALHLTFVHLCPSSRTGALVQSLQYVFEEKVMSAGEDDPNMAPTPPLLLVSAFVGLIE